MPIKIFESSTIFGVAADAANRIDAEPRIGGQQSALIAIVFSVVSLETFLNEIADMAMDQEKCKPSLEPYQISVFAQVMADAEETRARLESKLTLARWVLTGTKLDRSKQPYQDFALLMRLRNDLVHFKGTESFEQGKTAEEIHKDLIRKFEHKHILAQDTQYSGGSWIYLVSTKAVAEWSCITANQIVKDFCSMAIPNSGFKATLESLQQVFNAQCAKLGGRHREKLRGVPRKISTHET